MSASGRRIATTCNLSTFLVWVKHCSLLCAHSVLGLFSFTIITPFEILRLGAIVSRWWLKKRCCPTSCDVISDAFANSTCWCSPDVHSTYTRNGRGTIAHYEEYRNAPCNLYNLFLSFHTESQWACAISTVANALSHNKGYTVSKVFLLWNAIDKMDIYLSSNMTLEPVTLLHLNDSMFFDLRILPTHLALLQHSSHTKFLLSLQLIEIYSRSIRSAFM